MVQGSLFELSLEMGYGSKVFINTFMRSKYAANLDMSYQKLQWMGEEYIMEVIADELRDKLTAGEQYSSDALYWIGYTYRYWHFLTGESSKDISRQAPADVMRRVYPAYHTFANPDLAIERLKEYANDRAAKKKSAKRDREQKH